MNDFAELGKIIAGLEELATKGIEQTSAELEPTVQRLLDDQYVDGRGPGGKTWDPLKATGRPSHLQDTFEMSAQTQAVRGVRGVNVRVPSPGGYHQDGTGRMVAREIVPSGETFPPDWEAALSETAASVIVEKLTG